MATSEYLTANVYSFQGVIFNVLNDPFPGRSRPANVNVVHIPGGNVNYFQLGGKGPKQLVYQVYLDAELGFTYYVQLEDLLGTQGTLVAPDGASLTAILMSFERGDWLRDRVDQGSREMTARATFSIVETS